MNLRLTRPPEYKLMPDIVEQAKENTLRHGGSFEIIDDFDAGFAGADILYPKSWGSWLTTEDEAASAESAPNIAIGSQMTGGWLWRRTMRLYALPACRSQY